MDYRNAERSNQDQVTGGLMKSHIPQVVAAMLAASGISIANAADTDLSAQGKDAKPATGVTRLSNANVPTNTSDPSAEAAVAAGKNTHPVPAMPYVQEP